MTEAASPTGQRILVVDDEADIVALIVYHLAKAGYRISTAATGLDALDAALRERPALIVLDLMLPGLSGYEVLEQLRGSEPTKGVGVLMLTARVDEADRVRGLALGADDYLTKPFSPQELVLRVGAILRRMTSPVAEPVDILAIGPIHIDKLLLILAERRGRVQARAHLLETVWEAAPDIQTRTVDMHVQRLRAKLGDAGSQIETVRGFGYRFRAEVVRAQ